MKTIRKSTVAMMIALVSTAALGPGTFFAAGPDAASRRPLRISEPVVQVPDDLLSLMEVGFGTGANHAPAMLLADDTSQGADFLSVDFAGLALEVRVPALAQRFTPGGSEHARANGSAGAGSGYGAAGSAAPAWSGMQLARSNGALSGLRIGWEQASEATGPSALALDDPDLVGSSVQQAPALRLGPAAGELDAMSQADTAQASGGHAIPEPATLLLIVFGLLSLAAAKHRSALRKRA